MDCRGLLFRFLLTPEVPFSSCDVCPAGSGPRKDPPAARATTARVLEGPRRKPEPHIPHKREWKLLESATWAISIEVRMGTFLTRLDRIVQDPAGSCKAVDKCHSLMLSSFARLN